MHSMHSAQHVCRVTSSCNQRTDDEQLREVRVPDVPPRQLILGAGGNIDMVTGDFVAVFDSAEFKDAYDAVASSFFLDTAHNIIEYLQARSPSCRMHSHVHCFEVYVGRLQACCGMHGVPPGVVPCRRVCPPSKAVAGCRECVVCCGVRPCSGVSFCFPFCSRSPKCNAVTHNA